MSEPVLRFPEYSGIWNELKLGEIVKFSKGKGISKSEIAINGSYECIRYGELYTYYGEIIEKVKSRTNVPKEKLFLSKYNDVIIPASGETAIDIATASCVKKNDVAIGGDINVLRSKMNGGFLAYYLNSVKKSEIARFSQGISVIHLYSAQLKLLNIFKPNSDEEEEKIANFLSSVDKKICNLKEKYNLLQQYKKGVMQKIFSQEIQFKDHRGNKFPNWEIETLSNILKLQDNALNMIDDNEYELITVKRRNGGIVSRGIFKGKEVLVKNQFVLKQNQFIISKRQIVHGACGMVPKYLVGSIVSNEYNVFEPITDKLDIYYFNLFASTLFMKKAFFRNSNGVHIEKLLFKTESWLKTKIELPSVEEQKKIVNFINAIDKKINLLTEQIEQIQTFKKGLLQQMFV